MGGWTGAAIRDEPVCWCSIASEPVFRACSVDTVLVARPVPLVCDEEVVTVAGVVVVTVGVETGAGLVSTGSGVVVGLVVVVVVSTGGGAATGGATLATGGVEGCCTVFTCVSPAGAGEAGVEPASSCCWLPGSVAS